MRLIGAQYYWGGQNLTVTYGARTGGLDGAANRASSLSIRLGGAAGEDATAARAPVVETAPRGDNARYAHVDTRAPWLTPDKLLLRYLPAGGHRSRR